VLRNTRHVKLSDWLSIEVKQPNSVLRVQYVISAMVNDQVQKPSAIEAVLSGRVHLTSAVA